MDADRSSDCSKTLTFLRKFLSIQQHRAEAYSKLKRGFGEYMKGGGDGGYQELCSEITAEFNDCSTQVMELESLLVKPDCRRVDLAELMREVQEQEKQKLRLTGTIQVLKTKKMSCGEEGGEAEYESTLKEAIRGEQKVVMNINQRLEEVMYEIAEMLDNNQD